MTQELIKKFIEEKQSLFKQLDAAIDKTFNSETRAEGIAALEEFRGKDDCVPFFIGYAHEQSFYDYNDQQEACKAIKEYEFCCSRGGYDFLKDTIAKLKAAI